MAFADNHLHGENTRWEVHRLHREQRADKQPVGGAEDGGCDAYSQRAFIPMCSVHKPGGLAPGHTAREKWQQDWDAGSVTPEVREVLTPSTEPWHRKEPVPWHSAVPRC